MQIPRSRERITVEIPIVITTVLESMEGVIVDLSEGGAQITGCSLPPKSQCQIDLDGYVVFGTVRWSEEDRMGIRFPFTMTEGPLFEKLAMAKTPKHAPAAYQLRPATSRPAPVASIGGGGFGRRRA
ncbi:PilZ domain-containing protein [Sphingobium aromaticiconvertens]|uniref:PilZ domain-containing protein n=1 Tax=Sphingobium aromaticiconvertens TaxID=365341 RepID=UPI0030186C13